jgi:hypothetical protein
MPREYPWQVCPVAGCNKRHRRLFKWCIKHEQRLKRNGHPTEYRVKFADLNEWRPIVATMLNRWCDHEAIQAGLSLMHEILHGYGVYTDQATTGRRVRPYMDRLIRAGATARSSLIEMAALAFYYQNRRDWPEEPVQVMAFAARLLLHIPGAANSKNTWPRKVIGALGYRITQDLRPLLIEMWLVHEKTHAAHAQRLKITKTFSKVVV